MLVGCCSIQFQKKGFMQTAARWVSALTTRRNQFVERTIIPASDVQRAVMVARVTRLFGNITESYSSNFITAILSRTHKKYQNKAILTLHCT